jgi:hypothetical protein
LLRGERLLIKGGLFVPARHSLHHIFAYLKGNPDSPCGYIQKDNNEYEILQDIWSSDGFKGIKSLEDIGLCTQDGYTEWKKSEATKKLMSQLQTGTTCSICGNANITITLNRSGTRGFVKCSICNVTTTRQIEFGTPAFFGNPFKCELCDTTNSKEWQELFGFNEDEVSGVQEVFLKLGDKTFSTDISHRFCQKCYDEHKIKIDAIYDLLDANDDELEEQEKNRRIQELKNMTKEQLIEEIKELEERLEEAIS